MLAFLEIVALAQGGRRLSPIRSTPLGIAERAWSFHAGRFLASEAGLARSKNVVNTGRPKTSMDTTMSTIAFVIATLVSPSCSDRATISLVMVGLGRRRSIRA